MEPRCASKSTSGNSVSHNRLSAFGVSGTKEFKAAARAKIKGHNRLSAFGVSGTGLYRKEGKMTCSFCHNRLSAFGVSGTPGM